MKIKKFTSGGTLKLFFVIGLKFIPSKSLQLVKVSPNHKN